MTSEEVKFDFDFHSYYNESVIIRFSMSKPGVGFHIEIPHCDGLRPGIHRSRLRVQIARDGTKSE